MFLIHLPYDSFNAPCTFPWTHENFYSDIGVVVEEGERRLQERFDLPNADSLIPQDLNIVSYYIICLSLIH